MSPHRASCSRQPLAQLATAFCAGICAATYFPARLILLLVCGVSCSAIALVALKRRQSLAGHALLVAMALAGATLSLEEARPDHRSGLKQLLDNRRLTAQAPLILTGFLDGPPEVALDRVYLVVRVESVATDGFEIQTSGVVSLLAPLSTRSSEQEYRGLQLRYGTRIRVAAKLSATDNYRNPGVSPLSEYLDRKGYDASGVVKSPASITPLGEVKVFPPLAWLYGWRQRLQREIDSKFDPETAGVLDAALLGNRHNLSRDTAERFREGGTFHVLVISGLHISSIGGVLFLATRRLTTRRWFQFLVPATVVWAYSFAVGAQASVVRAALMFTFAGLALVLFREATSLNALGAATLVLLVRSPKEIFDPSFQLTFLSVLAILAIAWPLLQTCARIGSWYPTRETPHPPTCSRGLRSFCELLFWSERNWKQEIARSSHHYQLFKSHLATRIEAYRIQFCLRYIFGAVVVSAAVQLLLLPLAIVYFHRVSLASVVVNIIVSLLLAALVVIALLSLLLSQISAALVTPLFKLAETINWLMIHSVDPFAQYGLASIRLPEYSGWPALVYGLYYIPLLALAVALARWRPLELPAAKMRKWVVPAASAQILLVAILIFHPFSAGIAGGKLRVDFLDVGQGDAALITMPDGTTVLVDGGGRPQLGGRNLDGYNADRRGIGEAVVSEYLWWRGLDAVDYVVATHADADHIDGLNDVLRNFTVKAAFVARTPANDPEYSEFAQTLASTVTHVATIQANDMIRFGDVEMRVLWPRAREETNEPSGNNDSIVLRLQFGARSLLFAGDIEKSAERALVTSRRELRADVVKVPHHGSRSSSTQPFVTATKPAYAIVSVAKNSMFGHPHREVVERWEAHGTRVLTTGDCGTITLITDGTNLIVQPQKCTRRTN